MYYSLLVIFGSFLEYLYQGKYVCVSMCKLLPLYISHVNLISLLCECVLMRR